MASVVVSSVSVESTVVPIMVSVVTVIAIPVETMIARSFWTVGRTHPYMVLT